MIYGLDFLGLAKYSKVALQEFPNGFGLGCFSSTFGDARPAVEAIIKAKSPGLIRVQLAWKDGHNFSPRDFAKIKEEAGKWHSLVNKYPGVGWYFSGACEHKLNLADAMALKDVVIDVLPSVAYVNCPIQGGADLTGYINERHGSKATCKQKNDAFSFDGSACVDANVTALKSEFSIAPYYMFWDGRFNGRYDEKAGEKPPPISQRKGWPDARHIRSIVALAGERGLVSLRKDWLYKSHSENKGNGDPRAEKPVMICPIKTRSIELVGEGGRPLASLKYYGPYSGGGYRYYSTKWGYEIAKRPVDIYISRHKYGTINPVFRCGSFR